MRAALARLKLSSMISSSIRFSLTGGQVGWTTKMSRPRTSSSMRTEISPSGKFASVILPSGSPSAWAIFSASGMLARPLKTLSLLLLFMVPLEDEEIKAQTSGLLLLVVSRSRPLSDHDTTRGGSLAL